MKHLLKHLFICWGFFAVNCVNISAEVEWVTDLQVALRRARVENKHVLLDFTGSDWCGWCMRLKGEVFDQPKFAAYAKANLIMVEVDFPRRKELSASQQEANNKLARKYDIEGYPTIIVLDAKGQQIGKSGYVRGGPQAFINTLEAIPSFGHHTAPEAEPEPEPVAAKNAPAEIPVATVPNKYGDIALKGISGLKNHRLAMINNATLAIGETAKVKVHDERVDVTLQEIKDDAVVILIAGSTRELKLAEH